MILRKFLLKIPKRGNVIFETKMLNETVLTYIKSNTMNETLFNAHLFRESCNRTRFLKEQNRFRAVPQKNFKRFFMTTDL